MDDQSAHLAENAFGNIARALCCQAEVQPVLAALLSNDLKGVQAQGRILAAKSPTKKIVCFIDEHDKWATAKLERTGLLE